MKLRCVSDSVRLRLCKSDIRALETTGKVQESLHLGPDQLFTFSLHISNEHPLPQITLHQGHLQVSLPEEIGKKWILSNQVGIEYSPEDSSRLSIHLLIEKDFPCKDRLDENKSDTFWELSEGKSEAC